MAELRSAEPFTAYLAAQERLTGIIAREGCATVEQWLAFEGTFVRYWKAYGPDAPQHPRAVSERATWQRGSGVAA